MVARVLTIVLEQWLAAAREASVRLTDASYGTSRSGFMTIHEITATVEDTDQGRALLADLTRIALAGGYGSSINHLRICANTVPAGGCT